MGLNIGQTLQFSSTGIG